MQTRHIIAIALLLFLSIGAASAYGYTPAYWYSPWENNFFSNFYSISGQSSGWGSWYDTGSWYNSYWR